MRTSDYHERVVAFNSSMLKSIMRFSKIEEINVSLCDEYERERVQL